MTRTTNARIAGVTYLFYAAIGICIELLMHQARGGYGGAAMVARIGQYATNVRLAILITLLECLSSLVLGVTLYGITHDEDHELAMLGLVCRVADGVLGSLKQHPGLPGTAVAGQGGGRDGCPGHPHNERASRVSADAGPERPPRCDLLCRGEFDLFLSSPARTDGPRLNRMAGRVRVGPARGGTAPAARRFLHWAAGRILPVAAGARIPSPARAVAAHQRCRHTGDAMSPTPQDVWIYGIRDAPLEACVRRSRELAGVRGFCYASPADGGHPWPKTRRKPRERACMHSSRRFLNRVGQTRRRW